MAEYHPPSLQRLHVAFAVACFLMLAATVGALVRDHCASPRRIQQVALKDLPLPLVSAGVERVERCVTCHQSIDGPRGVSGSDPALRAHPRLDLFVAQNSKHPYASFGCSICHQGEPMGVEFSRAAHSPRNAKQAEEWRRAYGWAPLESWEQTMLPLQNTEASCLKCHEGLGEIPEAAALNEGRHLFRGLGCANCHQSGPSSFPPLLRGGPRGGDPFDIERVGPDLRRIGEKGFQPWVRRWIADPPGFRPSTRMPRLFGLENRKDADGEPLAVASNGSSVPRDALEIEAITTYLFATSKLREEPPATVPAGKAENGRKLFVTVGCAACHPTRERSGDDRFVLSDFAPDLSRIGGKVPASWLFAWLKHPRGYWAETKMPDLGLADADAADLAAYLLQTMQSEGAALPSLQFPEEAFDALIIEKLSRTMPRERVVELLKDAGGLFDTPAGKTERVGLSSLTAKVKDSGGGEWTETQIAKVREVLSATPDKARAVKAFFAGEFLIQHHNCFGCHAIQGWMRAPQPCPNLQGEGSKNLARFAFGATLTDGLISRTRWDWLRTKVSRPRVFDQGSLDATKPFDRLRMPQFELTPPQTESLVTHLLSLTTEPIPSNMQRAPTPAQLELDRGKRVFRELNCASCHALDPRTPPRPTGAVAGPDGKCRVKETWLRRKLATDGPPRGMEDNSEAEAKNAAEMLRAVERYLGHAAIEPAKSP